MSSFLQDLRVSFRTILKRPAFAIVVILTLATGIGASTAIFSVVKAVQFDALPYPDADRLVNIYLSDPAGGMNQLFLSYPEFEDYRERSQTLEKMATYNSNISVSLTGDGLPQRLPANLVTPSYFEVLGSKPALGRLFGPEDNRTPNGHPVVILSHGLWQRSFGGDRGILGQAINLSGTPYTVVGVLSPDHFDITGGVAPTEVWLPIMQIPSYWRPDDALTLRRGRVYGVLARRKPDATFEQAVADVENIGRQLQEEYPENEGILSHANSVRDYFFSPVQTPTFALLIGAALLLLIGCANVAGLMLVRAAERRKESALRLALGASRARLLRQLGTESMLLVLVAGALGIVLGSWLLHLLVVFSPVQLPGFVNLQIDAIVLLAALALSLAVGLGTATVSAVSSTRVELRETLSQGGRSDSSHRSSGWARRILIAAEVAMAVVLLIGAALMVQTFSAFGRSDVGFDPERLLTMRLDLQSSKYAEPDARRSAARQLAERLESTPGVESVTFWSPRVPGQVTWFTKVFPSGVSGPEVEDGVVARRHHVSADGLEHLGIPLLAGRGITHEDTENAFQVVVVSKAFADHVWPGEDALGKQIRTANGRTVTVVGMAANVKQQGRLVREENPRDVYYSYPQVPRRDFILLLRAHQDAAALTPAVQQAIWSIDPEMPLFDVMTMEDRLALEGETTLFTTFLLSAFAALSLFLALLGVYGVLAYSVRQRQQEIGIRRALGATPASIFRMVVGGGMKLVTGGLFAGLVASWLVTRYLTSVLFGVSPQDPATFLAIAGVLVVASMAACYLPARRATKIDPMVALRYE